MFQPPVIRCRRGKGMDLGFLNSFVVEDLVRGYGRPTHKLL